MCNTFNPMLDWFNRKGPAKCTYRIRDEWFKPIIGLVRRIDEWKESTVGKYTKKRDLSATVLAWTTDADIRYTIFGYRCLTEYYLRPCPSEPDPHRATWLSCCTSDNYFINRNFSSDIIEHHFAHLRAKGGSHGSISFEAAIAAGKLAEQNKVARGAVADNGGVQVLRGSDRAVSKGIAHLYRS